MKPLLDEELKEIVENDAYKESRQEYCDKKEAEGYKIFYPSQNELCLDLDSVKALTNFINKFTKLKKRT